MSVTGIARDAATAAGFGDRPPPKRRMRLTSFRAVKRGALVGFANIRLPNSLLISGCTIWRSAAGRTWAALPAKEVRDSNGKRSFETILSWPDRATNDRWSSALVELVRQRHPEAFDDEADA